MKIYFELYKLYNFMNLINFFFFDKPKDLFYSLYVKKNSAVEFLNSKGVGE